ncbi:MAG: tRNA-intron lyase, partial [Thermoplasmata archaeon]|nr:tRNA-intron lyase [Thermoplasmata archaeon]
PVLLADEEARVGEEIACLREKLGPVHGLTINNLLYKGNQVSIVPVPTAEGRRAERADGLNTAPALLALMPGRLQEGKVRVSDEADGSRLYNRGYFGNPLPGGGVELDLVEAAYLSETGKLDVTRNGRRMGLKNLLRQGDAVLPNFEIRYLVYRDLRQRGYVVKAGVPPLDFRVFPRGAGPDKAPTRYWVLALSERSLFDLGQLEEHLGRVARVRKELLLAVVDEESDITYYRVSKASPRGSLRDDLSGIEAEALFLNDRSLVVDPATAQALYERGFYGKMLGERLQLSLLETLYLAKKDALVVRRAQTGRKVGLTTLLREATRIQPDFRLRLRVYEDLKERGILVKTGFKYGAHFRGYEGDPDAGHAKYLIHALPGDFTGTWPEVSRAVRLAHGVRKEILLGRTGKEVVYLRLQRLRP